MGVKVASELRFRHFTYAQKYNEIILSMQLISYQNLSTINGNHRNNVPTPVATVT
jgi:hypothetical protein